MRTRSVVLASLAAATLAGCSSSAPSGTAASSPGATTTITVDAASSLTEAFTALRTQFEKAHPRVHVMITFGASSELATQIAQGAAVDVFASASEKNMAALGATAVAPQVFAANTLEIAVPKANPGHVTALGDLAKPGVKVAVCDPAVPCGAVAEKVFANAHLNVHPVARLADVKSTLATVESGEVDAGLVYVTDVRAARGHVTGVPIPAAVNASTRYPIAVIKSSRHGDLAAEFVQFVASSQGRAVLLADGFAAP